MRVTFLLILIFLLLAVSFWVTLGGFLFSLAALFWLFLLIVTVGYADTSILFFLGAREIRSTDEPAFFKAASQEAYKLSVSLPKLYFYNGTLDRGFVLESRHSQSLVLSKSLLETCSPEELDAICFELLLQVKKGMASKRTKVMFLLGTMSWMTHSFVSILIRFIPNKEVRQSTDWCLNYFLYPWMNLTFSLTLGEVYFRKLRSLIQEFPIEDEMLGRLGLKLRRQVLIHSLPSRKLIELSSITRNKDFQNILALEFLPHEWDLLFSSEDKLSAPQV
jgi:hypothetical protein